MACAVARGVVVLPKSVTPARIEKNLKLVKLDEEEMKTLNELHKTKGQRFIKPAWPVPMEFSDWQS
jgi:glycerol 2-dehydrogenase (NADP+)